MNHPPLLTFNYGRDILCKQGAPTFKHLKQLRGYMKHVRKLTGQKTKGILVHGGAANSNDEVMREVAHDRLLKVVRYSLRVDFGT